MAHRTEQICFAASQGVHYLHLYEFFTQQRQSIKGTEAVIQPIPLAPLAHLSIGLQPYQCFPEAQFLDRLLQLPA